MVSSDVEALVRALGELAISLRRRRSDNTVNRDQRAVLKWLRSLSCEELASLCCVQDVGFVKTLLHMAARSRATRCVESRVHEFHLLPLTASGASTTQNKRTATKTAPRTAPREFVKRPVVRTVDGDVVSSCHTREYEECCLKVLKGMRVLNTLQSCDTVALSMEFFRSVQNKRGRVGPEFFHMMEVVSRGEFLMECPAESMLKHRVWGETKWLKKQGYYSLQALFVNQIELNIWAFWRQQQKDTSAKIPLRGLSAKLCLVHEWEIASVAQQNAVLQTLGSKTMTHLQDLKQSTMTQSSGAEIFQATRSSLEALMSVLTVYQQTSQEAMIPDVSVDNCFTCSFEGAVTFPQAAVIKLLLAEHLQDQCSLLLCERLSKEEELSAGSNASTAVSHADGVGVTDNGNKDTGKVSNHSQRRRASRKKMLKQRRRQGEIRVAQQARFASVLHELRQYFCRRHEETISCEEELSAGSNASTAVSHADGVGVTDNGNKDTGKVSNHSQRRRASRKKMLKQRRREGEIRVAQQARFASVLHELRQYFCRRHEETISCVKNVLRDVIDSAVGDDQLTPGGWSVRKTNDTAHVRHKRKKKKKAKKKVGSAKVLMGVEDNCKRDRLSVASPQTPVKPGPSSTKTRDYRWSDEGDTGDHSAATAGSDSSPSQHDRPRLLDSSSDSGSTHDDGARLSFFSNVGSTGTTASAVSAAPPPPLSTFGSHSLYSSSTTTPFFLSLAPRDHNTQPPRVPRRGIDDDAEDHEESQTSSNGPGGGAPEAPSTSDTSNFEWYLPSVFSLQTSAHRTISPTPALDWHFNNWQFKAPDGGLSDK
ncbi:hypothetical protein PHPALM_29000, partial [Phytophthora palmivora]